MAPPPIASPTQLDARSALDVCWQALFRGMDMAPATQAQLLAYLTDGKPENETKPVRGDKVPGLLNLLVSLPEYQLC